MKENLLRSIRLSILATLIFSGFYSVILLLAAVIVSPTGGTVGISESSGGRSAALQIAQGYSDPQYFWGRPSAVNYDAGGSAGSNKGPTNPDYLETVKQRIDTFLVRNPEISRDEIPSELVTASGSGLDPHISKKAAFIQVARIAKERGIEESVLSDLIEKNTEPRILGVFGTERINVNKLNILLDEIQ